LWAIWGYVRRFVRFIIPIKPVVIGPEQARLRGVRTGLRWLLHVLVVVVALVLLYFANRAIGPWVIEKPWLQPIWLPVLGVLLYGLGWAAWWLYKLLATKEEPAYPDIDDAWVEAVTALGEAGLSLTDLPLFLVLGRPEVAEAYLFQAAQLSLVVNQTPSKDAPLHLYASRDAIYVTCVGASLLGRQAAILALEGIADDKPDGRDADNFDPTVTIRPSAPAERKVADLMEQTIGRPPTALVRRAIRRAANLKLEDLLQNTPEVERLTARLEHLCRLIVRDRRPYCPVNGLLVLVPLGSTDTDYDARQTGELLQRDLATLERTLQVHCPMFALVCDLETLAGFREFLQRLPPEDRKKRRLGQRFSLAPDLSPEALLEMVESSVQWLCLCTLRDWIFQLFQVEAPERAETADVVAGNTRLYLLLNELRDRQKRLSRVLTLALAERAHSTLRFGGCYFAGTGRDPDREQGLVAGLFDRLTKHQSEVSWTAQALADDAKAHRAANIGFGVLTGAGLAALAVTAWLVFGRGSWRR
jgi:hypothetical protein